MNLHVHVRGEPLAFVPAVRSAIARQDDDLPIFETRPLAEELAVLLAPQRAAVSGGVALLLADLGTYSAVAYSVRRRRREIGVRMAIGASPGAILCHVAGEGSRTLLLGLVLGLLAALARARYLEVLLVVVSPRDPLVFTLACVVIDAAGIVASYVPARRASLVDPAASLRQE